MEISEIISILEDKFDSVDEYYDWIQQNEGPIEGLGEVDMEEDDSNDTDGDHTFVVHFIDHDLYLATSGYYSSWNGSTWDNGWGTEVVPKVIEKTIYVSK